jgi:hypothetical protein
LGTLALTYDTSDNRVLKRWNGSYRLYVRGPGGAALFSLGGSPTQPTPEYYCYGPRGLCAVITGGRCYWLLSSRDASTRAVYDGNGVVAAYNYLPFGGFMGRPYEGSASVSY